VGSLWGRLIICDGLLIRLPPITSAAGRRIANPPQVTNLPHTYYSTIFGLITATPIPLSSCVSLANVSSSV
jgi:hypothetical protein